VILVDTSVLIDLFSGRENRPTLLLRRLIQDSEPFYLAPPIIREVLQARETRRIGAGFAPTSRHR